jgi:hypothetical protein
VREREQGGKGKTHRRLDQLQQIILQRLPLCPRELRLPNPSLPSFLTLQPIQIRQTCLRESRELVNPLTEVRDAVMRVKVDEIFQFAVDDPFDGAVAVFEFDAEDGVFVVEGVD